MQLRCNTEGVFTADSDECVYPEFSQVGLDFVDSPINLDRVGAARAKDGSATWQDPANFRNTKWGRQTFEWALQSPPPVNTPTRMTLQCQG